MTTEIYGATALFNALRTIIPNIPFENVESLTLQIGPLRPPDSIPVPTITVVLGCVNAAGEYRLNEEQTDVMRETKRFKVVPDDESPAEPFVIAT